MARDLDPPPVLGYLKNTGMDPNLYNQNAIQSAFIVGSSLARQRNAGLFTCYEKVKNLDLYNPPHFLDPRMRGHLYLHSCLNDSLHYQEDKKY